MSSANSFPPVPPQLLVALAQEPSLTRTAFLRSRTSRTLGVGLFWAICAASGLPLGMPNLSVLAAWILVPVAAWFAVRRYGLQGSLGMRNASVALSLLALAAVVALVSPRHWVALHPTCLPLLAFLAAPALYLVAWSAKGEPTSEPRFKRFSEAFVVCLAAGVPVSVICQEHDAPHLWLTHLLPAVAFAGITALFASRRCA